MLFQYSDTIVLLFMRKSMTIIINRNYFLKLEY